MARVPQIAPPWKVGVFTGKGKNKRRKPRVRRKLKAVLHRRVK